MILIRVPGNLITVNSDARVEYSLSG